MPPGRVHPADVIVKLNWMVAATETWAGVRVELPAQSASNNVSPLVPLTETADFGPFRAAIVDSMIVRLRNAKRPRMKDGLIAEAWSEVSFHDLLAQISGTKSSEA